MWSNLFYSQSQRDQNCQQRSQNVTLLQPRLFVAHWPNNTALFSVTKVKLSQNMVQLLFQFLEFNQGGVFIAKSWLRISKILKIETIAKSFKIFWSLQVRTCVYAYIGRSGLIAVVICNSIKAEIVQIWNWSLIRWEEQFFQTSQVSLQTCH